MQMQNVGAVIFAGPERESPQEQLVDRAIRASVLDLIAALHEQGIQPVIVAGPDLRWLPDGVQVVRDVDRDVFHFGTRLADLVEQYQLSPVIYFGAGSTPLLNIDLLGLLHGMLYQSEYGQGSRIPSHIALTNNMHSSDWVGVSHARDALSIMRSADRDNSLAWMLQENWEYDVRVLSGVRPSSSMDLDTPADLALVRLHPQCPPHLSSTLHDPLLDRVPVEAVLDVAARDGGRVALIGRVSPRAWGELSKVTQAWIRTYSEERGMVASGRLARGEVHSLLGRLLALLGPAGFFEELARMVDAAIIDTRVLMAAQGHYPSAADRFASDLFLVDSIADEWVRSFTAAAANAPIPILLGGHGVVAGGLYVLSEVIAERRRR